MTQPEDRPDLASAYRAPEHDGGGPPVWRTWLVGCGLIIACALACCVGTIAWRYVSGRNEVRDVLQSEADALGRNQSSRACSYLTPSMLYATPCASFVATARARAPYFPGSRITIDGLSFRRDTERGVRLDAHVVASGAHGSGPLHFVLAPVNGEWRIDEFEP